MRTTEKIKQLKSENEALKAEIVGLKCKIGELESPGRVYSEAEALAHLEDSPEIPTSE